DDELNGLREITPPPDARGRWLEDAAGNRFSDELAPSPAHAYNAVASFVVYELAGLVPGVDIPHVAVLHDGADEAHLVTQWIPGSAPDAVGLAGPEARRSAERLFAVQVLLAHRDAAGGLPDNVQPAADPRTGEVRPVVVGAWHARAFDV